MANSKYMTKQQKKITCLATALKKEVEKQIRVLEDYDVSHIEVLGREEYQECLMDGGEDCASGQAHDVVECRLDMLRDLHGALAWLPVSTGGKK